MSNQWYFVFDGKKQGPVSFDTLRTLAASQTLKHTDMLLREGIGWGNMPSPMVQEDLDAGRLMR